MKVNLVLLKVGGNNKTFTLPSSVTIVGRRQDCDLCIPLMVVSRRHCELNLDEGKLTIRDLNSANGTLVNGAKIKESDLNPGDKVQIGPITFIVQIDGVPAEITGSQSLLKECAIKSEVRTDDADIIGKPGIISSSDLNSTEIINSPSVEDMLSD